MTPQIAPGGSGPDNYLAAIRPKLSWFKGSVIGDRKIGSVATWATEVHHKALLKEITSQFDSYKACGRVWCEGETSIFNFREMVSGQDRVPMACQRGVQF